MAQTSRLLLLALLMLGLLFMQQGSVLHAFEHGRMLQADSRVDPDHAADELCEQCLAFAAVSAAPGEEGLRRVGFTSFPLPAALPACGPGCPLHAYIARAPPPP